MRPYPRVRLSRSSTLATPFVAIEFAPVTYRSYTSGVSEPVWRQLLRDQQAANFSDVAGAHASFVLPVSDALVSRLIAQQASPDWPVTIVEVQAQAANQFVVAVRLKRPSFLPLFRVRFVIERQPQWSSSPVMGLRLIPDGLSALATPFLKFVKNLPPGVAFDGSRLELDLLVLLDRFPVRDVLRYVTDLAVTTEERRFVVSVRAAL